MMLPLRSLPVALFICHLFIPRSQRVMFNIVPDPLRHDNRFLGLTKVFIIFSFLVGQRIPLKNTFVVTFAF